MPKAAGLLGRWTSRQRELFKKNLLSPHRFNALVSLGFVWDANEMAFNDKVEELRCFIAKYGHPCVPSTHPQLGMWVAKLRSRYRHGKLSQTRVEQLNRLGFVWSPVDAEWMSNYRRLSALLAQHSIYEIPRLLSEDHSLMSWSNLQRINRRKGRLSPHRILMLENIGFQWSPQGVANPQISVSAEVEHRTRTVKRSFCEIEEVSNVSSDWSPTKRHKFETSPELSTQECITRLPCVPAQEIRAEHSPRYILKSQVKERCVFSEREPRCEAKAGSIPSICNLLDIVSRRTTPQI